MNASKNERIQFEVSLKSISFFFLLIFSSSKFKDLLQRRAYLSRLMTKPTKWHVRPVKTQIRLGIRPV